MKYYNNKIERVSNGRYRPIDTIIFSLQPLHVIAKKAIDKYKLRIEIETPSLLNNYICTQYCYFASHHMIITLPLRQEIQTKPHNPPLSASL